MEASINIYLVSAAILSAIASLLHIGCIVYGASWYRFFGAGEQMATLAEQGSVRPTIVTSGIVVVLAIWSAYAMSGAGLIIKLPLLLPALIVITGIYLVRGIAGFFFVRSAAYGNSPAFWLWSSLICTLFGLVHLIGLVQIWPEA